MKSGLKIRLRQEPIWKWLESGAVAPGPPAPGGGVPQAVPENALGSQLVGLNMNPGRSITASTVRRSVGTPSMICGSGSVVTVTCAVCGSISIFARVMTVPRLNGPAITCVTIDRPNGAPS